MPTAGIRVLTIGRKFALPGDYEVRHLDRTSDLLLLFAQFNPDVIVSTPDARPGELLNAGYNVRCKWIEPQGSDEQIVGAIENVYYNNLFFRPQFQDDWPLVSVFTGTFNTGAYLMEAYNSLREQTYKNWEWVCVDDFSEDGTFERLQELAKQDYRVRPFRSGKPIRKIGGVKDAATRLCNGDILVELDHDDWLTDFALDEIRKAFQKNPDVGMVYSNCCNFFENGGFHRFDGPDWGPKQYRETEYHGKKWLECINHDVYDRYGANYWQQFGYYLTVGPNHVRAFRASEFKRVGGYNRDLLIADDFDLYSRFFLRSKCFHIDKMLYMYRFRDFWQNTTFTKNKSIQDHLQLSRNFRWQEFDAFNKTRLVKAAGDQKERIAFVIASKTQEDAKEIMENLKGYDVFVAIGKPSILDAYEEGRQHWAGRRRIVYVHNDVKFLSPMEFMKAVEGLPSGLHGVAGSGDPKVLDCDDGWWTCADCHGKVRQLQDWNVVNEAQIGNPEKTWEVRMLDGVCLVTVDQTWDWKVPGKPKVWHGYDWLACKRTQDAGGKCFTVAQPGDPLLFHKGNSRMGGLAEALRLLRVLTRTAEQRRDYPNIKDHLPRLAELAKGNVLELGCREGVSTSALLAGVEKNGGNVWSVDIDPAYAKVWEGHPQWKFILSDAADEAKIAASGVPAELDFLFIDTGTGEKNDPHSYDQTAKELAAWGLKVKPGGKIVLHDTESFPGVKTAAEEFAKANGFGAEFVTGCNGLGVLSRPGGVACPPATGEKGELGLPGKLTSKDVSYVIPVAVFSDFVLRCIQSIRRWSPGSEIIVVANGCDIPMGQGGLIDKIVPIETNVGFAAGCNRGAMEATKSLICIMNDDAEFVDDTPDKLIKAVSEVPSIVAPYCDRAKPPQGDLPKEATPPGNQIRDMVVGICMMMPVGLFHKLGGFDTRLNTYEDDDLCYRAMDRYGIPSVIIGGAWVHHERHATFRALGQNVQQIMNDNGVIFRRKHPKIKVIVIAKNEEKALPDFFKQFRPVTSDWCLYDTGSTDKTKEVAKSLGVKVAEGPRTDFASMRNAAQAAFAGDAEWVIMMDPDERLDNHTILNLKELIFANRFDIYLAPLWATNKDGTETEWVAKPFLYRNQPEIKWINLVHEKVIGSVEQALIKNGRINHLIALHDDGRREEMKAWYADLQSREPFYNDPAYREALRAKWPILDYECRDDSRIAKISIGPLVSVIIPTYKRRELVTKATLSALKQDYVNVEIIVIGDNDPDLKIDGLTAPNVRVYNMARNHGAGGAEPRNFGIAVSAGRMIAYLDDDNEWTTDHLSSVYEAMREKKASFGWSSMTVDGKDFGFTGELKFGQIDTSCVVHWKTLVQKYGWWKDRVTGGYSHDWEFFSRWISEPRVFHAKPTVIYNVETCGQPDYLRARLASLSPTTPEEKKFANPQKLAYRTKEQGREEILLTVAIPAVAARYKTSLQKVLDALYQQAEGKPVEVKVLLDNRKQSLSEKRNEAAASARGKFIAYVDDDDEVAPDYVESILKAIECTPDADCVVFDVLVHGYAPEPKVCHYGTEFELMNNADAYYRKPNHIMAFRTEIVRKVPYVNVVDEDNVWSVQSAPHIRKQVRVPKVLYHYKYDPKTSQQGAVREVAGVKG